MMSSQDILNFTTIDERLASSGQPMPEHFPILADEGFEAIINLATNASTGHLPKEPELCSMAGLQFTWLPVAWDAPTVEDYLAFQDWLDAHRHRKVLVHCAKNWRASLFCALYRVIREGLDPASAWDEVLGVWEPDEVWSKLARKVLAQAAPGVAPTSF
ncbi:MAG: protein tyrosine phosphatase family protein [Desulfovibrio sp.]|nr:protein tyrosine phosphatase family protein [Desulfovibrio sp.]MBI4958901.1 protein tyrosine phosphatase family protein [Desulfovibrio sp.]